MFKTFVYLDHWNLFQPDYMGRFMFERIHNTKEQIYFNEKEENREAKKRMFKSFKWANFPGKHPDAGMDHWLLERGVGFTMLIYFIYLKYPMKMK